MDEQVNKLDIIAMYAEEILGDEWKPVDTYAIPQNLRYRYHNGAEISLISLSSSLRIVYNGKDQGTRWFTPIQWLDHEFDKKFTNAMEKSKKYADLRPKKT
jgi:hypothetical protein